MALNWQNLVGKGEGEQVEEFLWNADIGSVIFTVDSAIIKNALFGSIAKFEKYPDLQSRCFQLLQDCHLLSPPGVLNEELTGRYDAILRSFSSWINKADVVLHALQFLSMVADRQVMKTRSVMQEDTELLALVNRAITIHSQAKEVQRAALQLFGAIIEHAPSTGLYAISARIFKPVLDNLLLKSEDMSICYSSFTILLALVGHARGLIAPWTDQLINICIATLVRRASAEICSKCLALLQQLAEDREALFTVARHEKGLVFFVDALGTLRSHVHLFAATTCLQLLLRILEDYDVAFAAFQTLPVEFNGGDAVQFAAWFKDALRDVFERYMVYAQQGIAGEEEKGKGEEEEIQQLFILYATIDELLTEMMQPEEEPAIITETDADTDAKAMNDYSMEDSTPNMKPEPEPEMITAYLDAEVIGSLPSATSAAAATEKEREKEEKEALALEKSHVAAKELVAQLTHAMEEQEEVLEKEAVDVALPEDQAAVETVDERVSPAVLEKGEPDHANIVGTSSIATIPGKLEMPNVSAKNTSPTRVKKQPVEVEVPPPSPPQPQPHPLKPGAVIIKAAYLSELQATVRKAQTQAAQALQRSQAMHKLFRDAALKIEELLTENDRLAERILQLQNINNAQEAELIEEKRLHQEQQLRRTTYFPSPSPAVVPNTSPTLDPVVRAPSAGRARLARPSDVGNTGSPNSGLGSSGKSNSSGKFRSPLNAAAASMPRHMVQPRPRWNTTVAGAAAVSAAPVSVMAQALPVSPTNNAPRRFFRTYSGGSKAFRVDRSPQGPAVVAAAPPRPMSRGGSPPHPHPQHHYLHNWQQSHPHARGPRGPPPPMPHHPHPHHHPHSPPPHPHQQQGGRPWPPPGHLPAGAVPGVTHPPTSAHSSTHSTAHSSAHSVHSSIHSLAVGQVGPHSGDARALEDSQHNLAVAGLLEGLDQVTLRRTTVTDHAARHSSTVEVNSSNLGTQTLHIVGNERGKHKEAEHHDHDGEERKEEDQYSPFPSPLEEENIVDDVDDDSDEEDVESHMKEVEALGDLVRLLFQHLFETQAVPHSPGSLQSQLHSNIIPLRRLRSAIETMVLLNHRNLTVRQVEVIFNQFRSKHVTLFGTGFALVLCGRRRFPMAQGMNLLRAIQGLLSVYLQTLHEQQRHQESIVSALSEPMGPEPYMTKREFDDVLRLFDREKKAFATLYEAYAPWVDTEHRKLAPSAPASAAQQQLQLQLQLQQRQQRLLQQHAAASDAETPQIRRVALQISAERYSLGYTHPGGISLPGLLAFAKEFQVMPQLVSRAQLVEALHASVEPFFHERALELARSVTTGTEEGAAGLEGNAGQLPLPPIVSAGGDHALSFPQFLDFILQLALRCPVFLRADNSPRVKLSNFLQLLNLSPGKDIVAKRNRGEMVVFRPLMEAGIYNAPTGFTSRGQPLQQSYVQETAAVVDPRTGAIVQVKRRKRIEELRELIINPHASS